MCRSESRTDTRPCRTGTKTSCRASSTTSRCSRCPGTGRCSHGSSGLSRELEILDGNDAEDTPLVRHGLLLALGVVEHHLWRPNGFGLLFREDVEIGVPLQVLVNETRVNPGGILVERDVEGFSDLVNL